MPEKKEQNKFTIQFNPADPAHRQTIDILNQQGRRKAQSTPSSTICIVSKRRIFPSRRRWISIPSKILSAVL